jgi:YD repeat-containing protein
MRYLRIGLALLACVLLSSPGTAGEHTATPGSITFLATTPLNGAAASRTFTISNPSLAFAQANLEVTRVRAAGTDLTLTCKSSVGGAAPTAVRTTCSWDAAGVCTSQTATQKSSTSTSEVLAWEVRVLGWRRTDCTLASTSANGSDTAAVVGGMVTY